MPRFTALFRSLPLLIVALGIAPAVHAQNHWPGAYQISPSMFLNGGDYAGLFRLQAQPNLSVNVYWNTNGEAVIFSGSLTGGWSNGNTSSVAWEYTYSVKVIQLDTGKAQIAIEWSRRSVTGQIESGLTPVGRILQSELGEISNSTDSPPANPPTEQRNTTSNITLPGGGGSGHWETQTFYYTVAIWDPTNWKLYVIGCSQTVTVWVSDGNGRGNVLEE